MCVFTCMCVLCYNMLPVTMAMGSEGFSYLTCKEVVEVDTIDYPL